MILVIFGSTGDLSTRMLFPSLYHLHKKGRLPTDLKIIGFARRNFTSEEFNKFLMEKLLEQYKSVFDEESWEQFSHNIKYVSGDLSSEEDFGNLAKILGELDRNSTQCNSKVFYLAISPDLYPVTLAGIKKTELQSICDHKDHVRVILEKPFGKDLQSYHELNDQLISSFNEDQVYRIDHYLGKETVKNILYFRAANPLFFNDWSNKTIDRVDVRVVESLGVGSRAQYYDQYGQLRDVVQSHLLQLLSLVVADLPGELTTENITSEKLKVLENLVVRDIENDIVRGQYTNGVVEGRPVKSYIQELSENMSSQTETYVKVKAELNIPQWEGVEMNLVSGKRMQNKDTSITLYFKSQERIPGIASRNKLVFQLQPMEGISLDLQVKKPGVNELEIVPMLFNYKDNFKGLLPDAYESLLLDIFRGNKSSFISSQELEASWRFIDPIIAHWKNNPASLKLYPAGTSDV